MISRALRIALERGLVPQQMRKVVGCCLHPVGVCGNDGLGVCSVAIACSLPRTWSSTSMSSKRAVAQHRTQNRRMMS